MDFDKCVTNKCGSGHLPGSFCKADNLDALDKTVIMDALDDWRSKLHVVFGTDNEYILVEIARIDRIQSIILNSVKA